MSETTTLRNFVLSAKDRENNKKKMMKKKIFDQKSRSSIFSNHGRAVILYNRYIINVKILFKFCSSSYLTIVLYTGIYGILSVSYSSKNMVILNSRSNALYKNFGSRHQFFLFAFVIAVAFYSSS